MSDVVSLSSLTQSGAGSQIHVEHSHAAGVADSSSSAASQAGLSDSVELSGAGSLVQQAMNAGAGARAARVQFLKQQFESGQYETPVETLASAVLNGSIAGE